ncbi:hypothetical protein RHSIM_Rhsim02G0100700 [Rhododendron simsii]|uniref:Cytochrome b561 domain-containing protein n=1 Tax=Rhododendron simsii TaxID=118357 RepID=A0A834HFU6_RHOSS|nr:hypothetical protein RHSIM_Rhsim02G0100700 [Rhododendron simsii]
MFLDNEMVIFATIELPENTTSVNHVWQDGPVSGDNLGMHGVSGNHLQSTGNLNLSSGQAFGSHGGNSKTKLKIAHGVLNAVSWGIMMPLGFMAARYLKALGPRADPLWFYTHVSLQLSGYFLGMAGGATGLVLGSMSSGNHHPCRMSVGVTLFALGLLQISALFLRPAKDHKHRHIWNWFHHLTGYLVLVLGLVNIWVGFTILKPAKGWIDDGVWFYLRCNRAYLADFRSLEEDDKRWKDHWSTSWLLDVSHVMLKDIWSYWYAADWSLVLLAVSVADSDAEFNQEEFFVGCFYL